MLQRPVVEIDGHGSPRAGLQARGRCSPGVAERHQTRDHASTQLALELQTQDIADFRSVGMDPSLPNEGPIGPRGLSADASARVFHRLLTIAWNPCSSIPLEPLLKDRVDRGLPRDS